MAKTTYLNMRIDPAVKEKAEDVFAKDGFSVAKASQIFLIASLAKGGFPFDLQVPGGGAEELAAAAEAVRQLQEKSAAVSAQAPRSDGTVVNGKKPGRNDPCPCGSGRKYKHCCGRG